MKIHGTAKGAALSTKDFGVAFGGAVPVTNWYEYTDQANKIVMNYYAPTAASYPFIVAHKNSTDSTQSTTQLIVYLNRTGFPTSSTIYSAIWDNTSPNPVKQVDGSTMSTDILTADALGSFTAYTFTFARTDVLANWSVGVYIDQYYTDSNFPGIAITYDGSEPTQQRGLGLNWSVNTAEHLTAQIGG